MVQKLALNLCFSAATQITDEQVPYADVALFCEVEGFTGKASSFVLLLRGGISPFSSSIFKDEGVLMDLAKSVILWKEQDEGLSLESKGGGYGPLWMFSNEDLVVDVPKNSYNDVGCAVIDLCSEAGALGAIRTCWMMGASPLSGISSPSVSLCVEPQTLPTLLKAIAVRKDTYPSLIVHSPKRPRRTQRELMDGANPLICQQSPPQRHPWGSNQ